jgi:hypothetical protein
MDRNEGKDDVQPIKAKVLITHELLVTQKTTTTTKESCEY